MSIINDALKKAGENKPMLHSPDAAASARDKSLRDSAFSSKKQKMNWGPVFVVMVLALITGPLLAPLFSSPFRNTNAPLLVTSYRQALAADENKGLHDASFSSLGTKHAQFGLEEKAILPLNLPARSAPPLDDSVPNFLMNGIVYSNTDSFCIINGKVLRLGDKIERAKLVAVTAEKATLELNGKKIDLWVSY